MKPRSIFRTSQAKTVDPDDQESADWRRCRHLRSWFPVLLSCVLVCALKLVLVTQEEIYPIDAPHDNLLYARLAAANYWGRPYDQNALIRAPAYPLWIAATRFLGVRHRIGAEVLYLASVLALTVALRAAGMNPWLAMGTCAALAMHRASFDQLNQLMREGFYSSVMLVLLALFIVGVRMLPKIRVGLWLVAGAVCSVLWHTREENVVIFADLMMLLILCALRLRRGGGGSATLAKVTIIAVLVGVPIIAGDVAVRLKTKSVHGVSVVDEVNSAPFRDAYCALMSIAPSERKPRVSISREAMASAARESAAFRTILPFLDGGVLARWSESYAPWARVEGEVTGNGVLWAVREAAALAGHHRSAVVAARFYGELAEEVKAALAAGRLTRRRVPIAMVDADIVRMLPDFPRAVLRLLRYFTLSDFHVGSKESKRPTVPDPADVARLREYQAATLLRLDLIGGLTAVTRGWIYVDGAELRAVMVETASGEVTAKCSPLHARPDVVQATDGRAPLHSGFVLDVPLGDWTGAPPRVVLVGADDARWTLPLGRLLRQGSSTVLVRGGTACRIVVDDVGSVDPRSPWRVALQDLVGAAYAPLLLSAFILGLCFFAAGLRRGSRRDAFWGYALAIAVSMVATRVAFLSVMDVAVFHVESRHVFPCLVLAPILIALLIQAAGIPARASPRAE